MINKTKNNNVKTKNNKILIGALVVAALGFNSCKKEEAVVTSKDSKVTKTEAFAKTAQRQVALNSTLVQITNVWIPQLISKTALYMKTNDGIEDGIANCAVVTIDSSKALRTATLDFGTGCTSEGKTFSGVITIQYTNPNLGAGSIDVSFYGFTVDSISLDGPLSYVNNGRNSSGIITGHLSANLTTNFVHDGTKLNGVTDIDFEYTEVTDVALFNISGSGLDENGVGYTQSTTEVIGQSLADGCSAHFVSGKLLIQSANPAVPDALINYGDGTCDDQATRTVNGVETQFTLN